MCCPSKTFASRKNRMQHIAIMKKSWGLTEKILSGQKKIESRWYMLKCRPWDSVKAGDTVYFKNSGEPVKIKVTVSKVSQFSDLTAAKVRAILRRYGHADGIEREKIPEFFERFRNKRYCVLVFLKNPVAIQPFEIDKTGFGAMAAWMAVDDIVKIKK